MLETRLNIIWKTIEQSKNIDAPEFSPQPQQQPQSYDDFLHNKNGNPTKIAFLGETNRGKSFIFNNLIGFDLSLSSGELTFSTGVTKIPIKAVYADLFCFILKYKDKNTEGLNLQVSSILEFRTRLEELEAESVDSYLCVEVQVPSAFLRENNVVLIDLPGMQGSEHFNLARPFTDNTEHRVDAIFAFSHSRNDPGESLPCVLYNCGAFNGEIETLPRIVLLHNERTPSETTVNNQLLSECTFETILASYANNKMSLYRSICKLAEEDGKTVPPTTIQFMLRRFCPALFIGGERLNDSKQHLSKIIAEVALLTSYKHAADLIENWSMYVRSVKEHLIDETHDLGEKVRLILPKE